ncbi:hypothetical protein Clacol_006127 [Clathrus columnatus]|uniref:Uncharacterized protein n=1 Tax=Clathrus columnatus TaxID=1419009 RepID=A0AAV5AGS9_9AGAM|nr:hypothetical protein Clacol_006127 [Clathrus columnatus]
MSNASLNTVHIRQIIPDPNFPEVSVPKVTENSLYDRFVELYARKFQHAKEIREMEKEITEEVAQVRAEQEARRKAEEAQRKADKARKNAAEAQRIAEEEARRAKEAWKKAEEKKRKRKGYQVDPIEFVFDELDEIEAALFKKRKINETTRIAAAEPSSKRASSRTSRISTHIHACIGALENKSVSSITQRLR